jgi:hypothetical protein
MEIKLGFEDSAEDREQFDVTVLDLLLDYEPSSAEAEQVLRLFPEGRQEMVCRLFAFHPPLGARVFSLIENPALLDLRSWRRAFAGVRPNCGFADEQERRRSLVEKAEQALSAGTGPGFQGMMPELVSAALHNQDLTDLERANLLVALGSGDFRQYLGMRLLDDLENRL